VIFIVDDDPRIRTSTAAALRSFGHDVQEFEGGPGALEAMASAVPDVLVTDVLMPDMKGPDLAARAVADFGVERVVFISGDIGDTPAEAFRGFEVLAKPFTAHALKLAVERVLGEQS
jgi:CheY-like chemotaxis protein